MTAIAARRKRRLIAAVATSMLSLVSLPSGLVLGTNLLLNDSGGQNVETDDLIRVPDTPTHLVGIVGTNNELASLVVIAMSPQGRGGTVVSVPVGAMADVAEGEPQRRIADSFVTGGVDGLRVDVENALNIAVDSASVHTASEISAAFAMVGELSVTMPQALVDTGVDGEEVIIAEEGVVTMSIDRAAAGLAAIRVGFDELTRLEPVKALWEAIADAAVVTSPDEGNPEATTTSSIAPEVEFGEPITLATIAERLLAGRVDVWQFVAQRVTDPQRNPEGMDMYALDDSEILMVMASVAPSALRVFSSNLAVMVDVPFNDSRSTQEAVTRLAYAGANVVLIRHVADEASDRTVAYVNDSIARTEVETYSDLIGPLEVVETIERIDGVNVRLVLGGDFLDFIAGRAITNTTVEQ